MIKSMTGFGKATAEYGDKTVTVEIRALNSKGADISLRLSSGLRNYELELRNDLSKQLERGKIDLSIFVESNTVEAPIEINTTLAKAYHVQLKKLALELQEPLEDSIQHILKFPDVLKGERKETDENEWNVIKACVNDAIKQLNAFRDTEGKSLQKDFEDRLGKIGIHLEEIKKLDLHRITAIKDRIRNNLADVIGKEKIDENRFEQELIYYIEKLDINEEKVRLKTHLDYFIDTCKENSPGRKLNFISQEIGREINTIGSKANDAPMQKFVVLMKDELEKIKEQASNVL
ncbi:YicC/YloC family endoribonuclease [Aurantibacillus circumpalustris]|uniref:YicC/YloC family endoribonuclease n=1 Tax=Aurantibacillus circumpalustris TaxID=3036359 RepID=UPI00295AC1BA|nr:YicC/YloC family endoribonuclease [Aurantibacillus circumpalustris]